MFSKLKKIIFPSIILSLSATLPVFAQDTNLEKKVDLDSSSKIEQKLELDDAKKKKKEKNGEKIEEESDEFAKEYINLDLKWFANQTDDRFQFGFDFDMYKEYKLDYLTFYTDLEVNTILEPSGSFGDIREEKSPDWQPHYLEFNLKGGIKQTFDDFTLRMFLESRRKMFVDLPIDPNQEYLIGTSIETKNFQNTKFDTTEEFIFKNDLEGRLQAGVSSEGNYYGTIDLRYDAFQFYNAMFYAAGSARFSRDVNETDLMYRLEIGARAENGTTLFVAAEKYKKVDPLFIVGLRFGGGINQYDSKGKKEKGLFFWPLSRFKLPRFNGEINTYNADSKYLISAKVRAHLLELNLGDTQIKPWVDARVILKGHIEPESVFADLNVGIDFDFFSNSEFVPFFEIGYYHTSYHRISTATKHPGSVNWLGGYIVSKNYRSFMKDSDLVEYRVGGGYFVNHRTDLLARLDACVKVIPLHVSDFYFGLVGRIELLWDKFGKTSLSVNCGPEIEYTFKEKTALFLNMGYFKKEESEISPAYIEGEGIAVQAGMRF